MNINWEMLRAQKEILLGMAMRVDHPPYETLALDGIINLLDAIQDEAVDSGIADEVTVFGFKSEGINHG